MCISVCAHLTSHSITRSSKKWWFHMLTTRIIIYHRRRQKNRLDRRLGWGWEVWHQESNRSPELFDSKLVTDGSSDPFAFQRSWMSSKKRITFVGYARWEEDDKERQKIVENDNRLCTRSLISHRRIRSSGNIVFSFWRRDSASITYAPRK